MAAFKDRLNRLRGQATGALQAVEATPPLAERMRRLGLSMDKPACTGDGPLAERLGGVRVAEGVIAIAQTLPLAHGHGRVRLGDALATSLDALCSGPPAHTEGLVFMDTETTGLAGGTGTMVFLLGLARLHRGGLDLLQLVLTRFAGEAALLEAARDWVEGARAMVTFNGRSFDAPLLAARYRLQDCANPFAALAHIDLLHATRRAFARRWPDCRLQSAEQRLLEFRRHQDLPGAMAPQAWFDWIRSGSMQLLPAVVRHNRWDLLSLAALLPVLEDVYRHPGRWGGDPLAVARYHRARGCSAQALATLVAQADSLCAAGLHELAALQRQCGNWPAAVSIWQGLAERNDMLALECLAKYYEHVRKDVGQALSYAERLVESRTGDSRYSHRLQRLHARLNAGGAGVASGGQ